MRRQNSILGRSIVEHRAAMSRECLEIRILQNVFLLINCIQFPGTFPVNNFTSHILVESHLEVYYDVHPT